MKWTFQNGWDQWDIEACNGQVVITRSAGPFGLPVSRILMPQKIATDIAKAIREADKLARNQTQG